MNKRNKEATRDRVLYALLHTNTNVEAARIAEVSVKTVSNYLRKDDFKRDYEDARTRMLDDATKQLQQSLQPAITCLVEIVMDKRASKAYRISAAKSLIDNAQRFTETLDLFKRVKALEEMERNK
jgi:hypothetical protein